MRAAEQSLLDAGETVESLMQRAGTGAAEWVWRLCAGRSVTVLCGPGNNGGDGYVIARELERRGVDVSVVAPLDPATDAAKSARSEWSGKPVKEASGHVFVDCLFGTGLSRPLSDDLRDLVARLAASHDLCVAIDLPSGVDSDTGGLLNDGLPRYDLTIALAAWKPAHWLMPASARMGERRVVDIRVGPLDGAARLAPRPRLCAPAADSHKYSRGMVLVVGGEMPGAAIMTARAAQHGGAGYVMFASEHLHPAMPIDIVHDDTDVADLLHDERIDAVVIGPGLGRDEAAQGRVDAALKSGKPLVLDADALHLITPEHELRRSIATPHEGELSALCEAFDVSAETKLEKARALHGATGMTILAKGADNILVGEGGDTALFPPAPSWLSTAGTGDVLAGLIASRIASGSAMMRAAEEAVYLHTEAARLARPAFSAGQLVDVIPHAYDAFL
ncbi:NAD(P)H-hydrate dehydratase [Aurantiacibacter aquimixticola]|uniref:Bifunctional NAD(P)H-hydrate repair enzyme n=2 Tax=Aurantiacibacter aquimixticola TaxID=1958945 RepID=A0A419RS82_9SPHN|nr:NAD(P)H-hydrate dehydratase [Aurantiacibacter aquimixticola]